MSKQPTKPQPKPGPKQIPIPLKRDFPSSPPNKGAGRPPTKK